MADCLIGYTGFVGSTLMRQHGFEARFNSANIDEATGQSFATVVCAAAPGSMFEANRFPERDAARLASLADSLAGIRADRFVLISTIAVLPGFCARDEDDHPEGEPSVYGANRLALERFVEDRFEQHLIVRLPALFGIGLRKNFLFDILNPMPSMQPAERLERLVAAVGASRSELVRSLYPLDERIGLHTIDRDALNASGVRVELELAAGEAGLCALGFTNPDSTFQYYGLERLWSDIGLALESGLNRIHLAPPPLRAGDVYEAVTGKAMAANEARLHTEDMRTRHAALFGSAGSYIAEKQGMLEAIGRFMAAQRVMA